MLVVKLVLESKINQHSRLWLTILSFNYVLIISIPVSKISFAQSVVSEMVVDIECMASIKVFFSALGYNLE